MLVTGWLKSRDIAAARSEARAAVAWPHSGSSQVELVKEKQNQHGSVYLKSASGKTAKRHRSPCYKTLYHQDVILR